MVHLLQSDRPVPLPVLELVPVPRPATRDSTSTSTSTSTIKGSSSMAPDGLAGPFWRQMVQSIAKRWAELWLSWRPPAGAPNANFLHHFHIFWHRCAPFFIMHLCNICAIFSNWQVRVPVWLLLFSYYPMCLIIRKLFFSRPPVTLSPRPPPLSPPSPPPLHLSPPKPPPPPLSPVCSFRSLQWMAAAGHPSLTFSWLTMEWPGHKMGRSKQFA